MYRNIDNNKQRGHNEIPGCAWGMFQCIYQELNIHYKYRNARILVTSCIISAYLSSSLDIIIDYKIL